MKINVILIIVGFAMMALGSICVSNIIHSHSLDDIVAANIEALASEETSTGIEYECYDGFCMVFNYRNRFIIAGCKAEDTSICKVQASEFPNINLGIGDE